MTGNPFEQQRALTSGEAVAALDRGVLTVTGPDRLSWLDSMTSQSLTRLRPGESAETLLLDPNGRIEHVLRVVDDGETAWLIVDAAEAAPLSTWLDRMRFMLRVAVADRSADFAVVGSVGASRVAPVETGGRSLSEEGGEETMGAVASWQDPWSAVQPGGYGYADPVRHPGADWSWSETVVPRGDVPVDAVPGGVAEALRIAAWRPSWSGEVDERSIPHEYDWLRSAVHLDKGCYRGQETVAKVHNLGHPPRRLVSLQLDGSDSVYAAHGDVVVLAGTDDEVGVVTSAAVHYELGPIALAVVKRSTDAAAGLEVVHDGTRLAARQEIVVPASAGATAEVPRIPRLGAVRR